LAHVDNPAGAHKPAPGTLVLINNFDCVYNTSSTTTYTWLATAITNLVEDLTGIAISKDDSGKSGKSLGANLAQGSADLMNTFSSVFSSADAVILVARGLASVLKSILASFDSVTQTSLHLNKTIRFIAPGAYMGVYVCDSSYNYKGVFNTTSFKLSSYGLYMATSMNLMKELEKLDTMKKVFGYYKEQAARFNQQSTQISAIIGDCANVHKQIGKFDALRISKQEANLKTDYLKKWMIDLIEQINDAIKTGDCDAKEGGEYFNDALGNLKNDIQFLKDAREDTYETMNKYVEQLQKLTKV